LAARMHHSRKLRHRGVLRAHRSLPTFEPGHPETLMFNDTRILPTSYTQRQFSTPRQSSRGADECLRSSLLNVGAWFKAIAKLFAQNHIRSPLELVTSDEVLCLQATA
jgi:hypothetical protein